MSLLRLGYIVWRRRWMLAGNLGNLADWRERLPLCGFDIIGCHVVRWPHSRELWVTSRSWALLPAESKGPESYNHKQLDFAENFSKLGSRFFSSRVPRWEPSPTDSLVVAYGPWAEDPAKPCPDSWAAETERWYMGVGYAPSLWWLVM